jgi:5-methylcytosine-specific restriction endonuclease McrA
VNTVRAPKSCPCGTPIPRSCRTCVPCIRARVKREQLCRSVDPITREVRAAVIARDGHVCRYCGRAVRERAGSKFSRPSDTLHIDHITPVCAGGVSTADNLVVACADCNVRKGGRSSG